MSVNFWGQFTPQRLVTGGQRPEARVTELAPTPGTFHNGKQMCRTLSDSTPTLQEGKRGSKNVRKVLLSCGPGAGTGSEEGRVALQLQRQDCFSD